MSGIRPLDRADLPAVSALYELVMRSGEHRASPAVTRYFERVLVDDPWADPEIPSLVHEAPTGEIVGFIGASTRRMRLDGRPLRAAVSSNLVVHPDWRPRGVGALLNRRLLRGPQELTLADRANEASRTLWLGLGGRELLHASVGWYRVLRPGSTAAALLGRRAAGGAAGRVARVLAAPLDAVPARVPALRRALAAPEPAGRTEPLTAPGLADLLAHAGPRLRLRPDYDAAYLAWVFAELEALRASRGRVVARLVRGPGDKERGWFVYLLPEGGVAEVVAVGLLGDDPEPVLDHLFHQAHLDGAAAVQGRLDPVTAGLLGRPGVVLRRTARALVQGDDALVGLLGSTAAQLSHLDGEWLVAHGARQ